MAEGSPPPALASFLDAHEFLSWLGVSVEAFGDGRAVLAIDADGKFHNPSPGSRGVVHGGVVASVIDTASGFALRSTFDDPESARLTTTDLNVSYLRPATGSLRAEATVLRAGGSTGVADVSVESDREEVAVGRATYRLFRDGGGSS